MVFVIREGDLTSTDGFVINATARATVQWRKLARMGDPVWCPLCQRVGFIAQGNPTYIDEYVAVATHNQTVQCECPPGSHRLLASPGSVQADMEATISIPADLADIARMKAARLSEAIHDGSWGEKLFSPLRLSDQGSPDNPFAHHQR
ncbi:PAAR domain-containing protein [Pseudomonas sp. NA-150]|uniref:PAAR domain-containing protein n=1 Tax=Pseudomonas sp. NA-150 TaxID=3367525 RepID=UPI0037C9D562